MKFALKRVSITLVALVTVFSVGLAGVSAQSGSSNNIANGFRISPVRSEFTIEKGTSTTLAITVENPTDVATVAHPVINDFIASEAENGEPRLLLDDSIEAPRNSVKNIVEAIPDVPLGPREKKDITVQIRVPDNARAGGYYGAIRFIPADLGQVDVVGIAASVGTLVLVRVPGDLTERLDLIELSAAQNDKAKSFFTSGDVQAMVRLKNEGDIHVQPYGRVTVKNIFGHEVGHYELNLNKQNQRDNILPGSTRKFVNNLENQKWLGRYTITANLGYTNGGELISSSTTFWYLPVWALIVLALLVLGLVIGGYFLYRRLSLPKPRRSTRRR